MKILKWMDEYLEAALCSLLLAAMSLVIMLQIIGRTVGFNVSWNEELARYMYIWLIYVGCAYAVKLRRHIKMEALLFVLGKKGQLALILISNLLFLIFAVVVVTEAGPIIYKLHYVRRQFSPAMRLPMSYPFASVLVGFALVSFRLLQDSVRLVRQYRRGEEF